jgi:hypothetical protein
MKALEVHVSPIHDIEGSWLDRNHVHDFDVVKLSIADMDKSGYRPTQIQKRMQFDSAFGLSELCPSKNVQTQVDRSRIESIGCSIQIYCLVLI